MAEIRFSSLQTELQHEQLVWVIYISFHLIICHLIILLMLSASPGKNAQAVSDRRDDFLTAERKQGLARLTDIKALMAADTLRLPGSLFQMSPGSETSLHFIIKGKMGGKVILHSCSMHTTSIGCLQFQSFGTSRGFQCNDDDMRKNFSARSHLCLVKR